MNSPRGPVAPKNSRPAWIALTLSLTALLTAFVVVSRPPDSGKKTGRQGATAQKSGELEAAKPKEGYVKVGGVHRPATDLKPEIADSVPTLAEAEKQAAEFVAKNSYGETPWVRSDANVYTRSVSEAFRTKTHPERLSVSTPATPFDPELYKRNPEAYLNVIEPGRVFDPAQPGPDVTPIEYVSERRPEVIQGETIPLQVQAVPDAPVTFTSFDLGRFEESLLTSITVKADEKGIATARFTGTPGTRGNVDILVASPMTSEQLNFSVNVIVPKPGGAQVNSPAN